MQEDAETILKALRPGLPLDEVESLRLSSIEREKIRDLVTSHSGLVEKQQTAKRAINTIQEKKGRVKAEPRKGSRTSKNRAPGRGGSSRPGSQEASLVVGDT